MWIVCAALSIIFNVIGWILASKKKITTCWVSVSSLAFVALTLLMEYRIILNWVNAEDYQIAYGTLYGYSCSLQYAFNRV